MLRRAPDGIYNPCMVHLCFLATENTCQLSCKIPDFGHPLYTGNVMLSYKEGHSLVLKYFITLPGCIRMFMRAPDSIYVPVIGNAMSFLPNITVNFHVKYQLLGTLSVCEMG